MDAISPSAPTLALARSLTPVRLAGAVLAAALALPSLALASEGWWDRYAEGWFWYEVEPAEVEPVEEPEPEIVPAVVTVPAGPAPLSAEWLKDNLPVYLNRAIDDPSPDNVRLYMLLQRASVDKASRFSEAVQAVVQSDAILDEYSQYPTGTRIASALRDAGDDARDDILRDLAETSGLLFFFDSACERCPLQVTALQSMGRLYGFEVIGISVDGGPMPDGSFPNYRPDAGQAEMIGIMQTPAIAIARPPDEIAVVSHGLATITDLQERITTAAMTAGWIDADVYRQTKPSMLRTADLSGITGAVDPNDPKDLLRFLTQGATP